MILTIQKSITHFLWKLSRSTCPPPRPSATTSEFDAVEDFLKNNKVIIIFPEANSYNDEAIPHEVWRECAANLKANGFEPIFNSNTKFDNYKNIYFSISETLYLATLAKGIVAFRSGLSEALALITTCKIINIYPDGKLFFDKRLTIEQFADIVKKYEYNFINDLSVSANSFKSTSIERNFNRSNSADFIYNFKVDEFINFILEELRRN